MNLPASEIKPNADNPRFIKDTEFKALVESLKTFPEMAQVRKIVVNKDHVILGGNMRFKAMIEAGWTEIPVDVVDWPEDKQREFIIKDNVSGGEWDWDVLANEWNTELLEDWGLKLPVYDEPSIKLPEGERGYHQMSFILSASQTAIVAEAIKKAHNEVDDFDNDNTNGNALFCLARSYNEHS